MRLTKRILAALGLSLLSFKSFSQASIQDFYQTGAIWQEEHFEKIGQGSQKTNYFWKITGDTLISNTTYKKLTLTRTTLTSTNPSGQTGTINFFTYFGTVGGIRVSNRQVYFLPTRQLPSNMGQAAVVNNFPMGSEAILYDFNLAAGTILNWKTGGYQTVNSMGLVTASNNQQLNSYTFNAVATGDHWIEGVGSNMGLFGSYRTPDFTNYFTSTCYSGPNLNYPANCSMATGVKETRNEVSALSLYPNPLTGNTLLLNSNAQIQLRSVIIINALGQEVFRQNLDQNPAALRVDLKPGIYSVNLILDNGQSISRKIVKAE